MDLNPKDKGQLRDYWKSQYVKYRSSFKAWNQAICQHILSHPTFQKAEKVALFYPREWEVNLIPLWESRPKACSFPRTLVKTWEMKFYTVNSLQSLHRVKGVGGILEPLENKSQEITGFHSHDLILVPGFVFDALGSRVGSGKGVYDRFLSREGRLAQKWGVAFSPQVVSQPITQESHDIRLDGLITEKGFIYF